MRILVVAAGVALAATAAQAQSFGALRDLAKAAQGVTNPQKQAAPTSGAPGTPQTAPFDSRPTSVSLGTNEPPLYYSLACKNADAINNRFPGYGGLCRQADVSRTTLEQMGCVGGSYNADANSEKQMGEAQEYVAKCRRARDADQKLANDNADLIAKVKRSGATNSAPQQTEVRGRGSVASF